MSRVDWERFTVAASRTARRGPTDTDRDRRLNFALGLAGEAGEVANYLKKTTFHGHVLEKAVLVEELGDVLWYVAMLMANEGITFDEVASANISKLQARYPQGFSVEASLHRPEVSHG